MKVLYYLLLIAGCILIALWVTPSISGFGLTLLVCAVLGIVWRFVFDFLWLLFGGNRSFTVYEDER